MPAHVSDDKTVLATAVYDTLKERIMDHRYPPGDRLNIDALALDLKLSPTPVREALVRLTAERLVSFEPFKGYRVSPLLTPDQVVDLMHVRRLLEVDAVRLATPRIRIPDLIALEKILSESAEVEAVSWSHGYRQFNQLDKQFHLTLFRLSGSQFLLGVYRSLNVHVELGRFYPVFVDMDHRATLNEHRAVFGALKAREVETAAAALTAHLNATEERILRLIDKHTLALAIAGAKSKERDV